MPERRALRRAALALLPGVALLTIGSLVPSDLAGGLSTVAGVTFLAVVAFEAVLHKSVPEAVAEGEGPERIDQRRRRRLLKLLSFIGTSTPTLAGAAEERDDNAITGWLELVGQRVETAVGCSAGVMVLREEWVVDDVDLVPSCEVAASGGSSRCVLPAKSRIPIKAGIAWDVGQAVGARAIFLSPVSIGEHRFWVCMTLVAKVDDPFLQPITNAMVAPVTLIAMSWVRASEDRKREATSDPSPPPPPIPENPEMP